MEEINDENLEFSLYENDWRFSEDETDLLNILSDYDVTHIAIKYVDNSKEEFMVAWSDLEKDFLSSTFKSVAVIIARHRNSDGEFLSSDDC